VVADIPTVPAEYLIAWSERRHILADCLDRPRDIRSRYTVRWLAQPGNHAEDVRHTIHKETVTDMDGSRADAYEYLAILDHQRGDVLQL
jgi:hypothetical protein